MNTECDTSSCVAVEPVLYISVEYIAQNHNYSEGLLYQWLEGTQSWLLPVFVIFLIAISTASDQINNLSMGRILSM